MQDIAMWMSFVVILCTIVGFAIERWPIEAVSLAATVAFLLIFSLLPPGGDTPLSPGELLSGYASPALITVLALLVIGQGLFNTDALDWPARQIARIGGKNAQITIIFLLVVVAITSAFMNNTPVVVMFIPIVIAVAAQKDFTASSALMPLSFIGILGGMTTLIGSSTNLLVAGVASRFGHEISFFSFTVPGLVLAGVGAIYVFIFVPRLLRHREGDTAANHNHSGHQFVAQIEVDRDHKLVGARSRLGLFAELPNITVRSILRGGEAMLPPFEGIVVESGDTVIVAATRKALTRALADGAASLPVMNPRDKKLERDTDTMTEVEQHFTLAEVVVAPGSRFAGRTIEMSRIRAIFGTMVLGLQRRSQMPRTRMRETRLEPGDTLLVGGMPEDLERLRSSRDLLLLEWSAASVPLRAYSRRAASVFLLVIVASVSGVVPIVAAALTGALAMIALGCLSIQQAARAFDSRIYMLVGAALTAATALEQTGGAEFVAMAAVNALAGHSIAIVLSALFAITAIFTNVLSNNATAVLLTPIAIGIADALGAPREAFIVCIIFAANCSFATPVSYQTNLLVMGPGHYSFGDFLRAGVPLVILLWLTFSLFAPWYYGL